MEVMEAGREIYEARQGFDKVEICTECIWQFLHKHVGEGFGRIVSDDLDEMSKGMNDAVRGMRLMAREVTVRQEKFEEVVRESRRQEVRVQECVGVAVSEEMSRSDERLRGVLRDLKGQMGVLQRELREGMGRVQRGMGKECGMVSDDESVKTSFMN
jgi:hypothetical protein